MVDLVVPLKVSIDGEIIERVIVARDIALKPLLMLGYEEKPVMTVSTATNGKKGEAKFFAPAGKREKDVWFMTLQQENANNCYFVSPSIDNLLAIALRKLGIRPGKAMAATVTTTVSPNPYGGSSTGTPWAEDNGTPYTYTTYASNNTATRREEIA